MSILAPVRRYTTSPNTPRTTRHLLSTSTRTSAAKSRTMLHPSSLSISPGSDLETILRDASSLVETGKWKLCNSGKGLERSFKFKSFNKTWEFMSQIAAKCKKTRHHPEWSNVYNKTHIRWTTHSPEGLSGKDTYMAEFCDGVARECGEVEVESESGGEVRVEAGDCCGKKVEGS
ncbi:pterin 4 alpha carbinolamine dehydratase like protein [Zymoseptoria brevis]|uniref:4a-hydroxytetrahydrobiopterin dehydratase n=1 Tax=Zymoseptoria brevis TaxID=1047168 RepID=A0A0F4GKT5_9PEZI|nr:pterin 4 alpha carbinolamine dehydratase like protein [Zymoseptoria brevis]